MLSWSDTGPGNHVRQRGGDEGNGAQVAVDRYRPLSSFRLTPRRQRAVSQRLSPRPGLVISGGSRESFARSAGRRYQCQSQIAHTKSPSRGTLVPGSATRCTPCEDARTAPSLRHHQTCSRGWSGCSLASRDKGEQHGRQGRQERQGKEPAAAREETETKRTTEAGQGAAQDDLGCKHLSGAS